MSADWIPPEGYGRFPFQFLVDILLALLDCEFVIYDDTPLPPKPDAIRVLLQHDVDVMPDRTMRVLEMERAMGLRSNVMLMGRCVDRVTYERSGVLRHLPYALDFPRLSELEEEGFLFGYHCNAYERSDFDRKKSDRIVYDDLILLTNHLYIRWYSAHGGPKDIEGLSNHILLVPSHMWAAHNCAGQVMTDGTYTDSQLLRGGRDIFDFIDAMKPGGLYRILLHPQYYHTPWKRITPECEWFDERMGKYAEESRD